MVLTPNNSSSTALPSSFLHFTVMQDYVQTTRSARAPGNGPMHTETMSGPSSPSSQSSWSTYDKFYHQHPHQGEYTTEPEQDDAQAGYPWHVAENRKFSATSTNTYYNSQQGDDEYRQYGDDDDFEQAKHYQQQQGSHSHRHPHQQRHATHPSSKPQSGSSRSKHMNAHTTCGRHSDQWLFQGWHVPSILKGKRRRNKDGAEEEEEEEDEVEERQLRR